MVSTTVFVAAVAAVATSIGQVQAHGYMEKPLAEFKEGTESPSAWVAEIAPQWKGDWDKAKGDEGLVALYKELKKSNNIKDIRTMIDGDPKLYGEACGNTDPKATPKEPPATGDATFSRGIVHAGPCEIWLDDEMVLQNDDCQSAYGDGTKKTISVFKPVDYSSCASSGCMFRFYWLALQRRDSKTLWQVYNNCVPLSGPAGGGGGASNSTTSGSSTSQTSPSSGESDSPSSGTSDSPSSGESESPSSGTSDSPSSGESESPSSGESESPSSGESESPSSGESDSPSSGESDSPSSGKSDSPSSGESDSPSTETTPAPETPSVETPETPPASDSKCSVRRRRH